MYNRWQHLQNLKNIFLKSVESVRPHNLLSARNNYNLEPRSEGNRVFIQLQGKRVDITNKRCHAVGFGKAVLGMAVELEKALGDALKQGILSIPKGSQQQFRDLKEMCLKENTVFRVFEGAENNQPDTTALQAAKEIKLLAESLNGNDILFVLISGGGSALLPLPKDPIKLNEKMQLVKNLSNKGASIQEMNQVRIALSAIKGGQLAAAASQASAVISFVISDIVGDPVDLIASGPTWVSSTAVGTRQTTAEEILNKYDLWQDLPDHMKILITSGSDKEVLPQPNNSIYVVGDNRVATSAAVAEAMSCNYNPFIASTTMQGDIEGLTKTYCDFLRAIYDFQEGLIEEYELRKRFPFDSRIFQHFLKTLLMCQKSEKPLLLITAGEPTVKVSGCGLGGRNQELALRLALEFYREERLRKVCFLSAGTDGIDGPTNAAGALACSEVVQDFLYSKSKEISDLIAFVENNDSYNFYKQLKQGDYHVMTGHTGTNVMDLHLFLLL
ncbi:glycerate kinase [Musca domestica]|uniref:Glycerate kinase n=1 Tax=Musca domestica TaxID=7370 RepID=A0A1I8MRT7_MUSDO|nr:glycerate kinase [Musca domestica]